MKKIINLALLLLCLGGLLASCDSDRDSNPTLVSPKDFVLNTLAYSSSTIDLATTSQVNFTWQYPDYGFPAQVNYVLQYSVNGKFDKVFNNEVMADQQTADCANGDSIYNKPYGAITGGELAKKMEQVALYPEGTVQPAQTVYVRGMAYVGTDTIYSNVITLNVIPYYVNLNPVLPAPWYMLGDFIADGGWANDPTKIGVGNQPMYVMDGATYDFNTGEGKFSYTGYFLGASDKGFKIVQNLDNWKTNFSFGGVGAGALGITYRGATDNDPGNIYVDDPGYYTVTIDTKAHTGTITPAAKDSYTTYSKMCIAGVFNGWTVDATPMAPVTTVAGSINHDWTCTVTFTDADAADTSSSAGIKFTDGSIWWSGTEFPFGTGSTGISNNLPIQAGTYLVVFNDITGSYLFLAQ